jgi:hypothetical protein
MTEHRELGKGAGQVGDTWAFSAGGVNGQCHMGPIPENRPHEPG